MYITILGNKADYDDTKLNSVMPILRVCKDLNSTQYEFVLDADEIKSSNNIKEEIRMKIKNIGVGTDRDIKIKFGEKYLTNQGKIINKECLFFWVLLFL